MANRGDPRSFPWTKGWQPPCQVEGKTWATPLIEAMPGAKVAFVYQNGDHGKDHLKGLEDGLGDEGTAMIVAEASVEVTDTPVDGQILTLKNSGADVLINITTPKFAAQAISPFLHGAHRPSG